MGHPEDNAEMDEGQRLETLDRDECISLLRHGGFVGRLGLIVDGRPLVFPVNFMFDNDAVVFCTAAGTKLHAIVNGVDVAFEIDDSRALHHSGWSVLVQGRAEVVTDSGAVARFRGGPLRPWAKGARANWIRVPLGEVSGRRIPEI